jgi:hypothetical protein
LEQSLPNIFTTNSIIMKFFLLSITLVAFALVASAAPSSLKGGAAAKKEEQKMNLLEDNMNEADSSIRQLQQQAKQKFDFVNQPYGLRFGGDIANLALPIVGLGRLIFKTGTACSFNGFGNLNSLFVPVSSEDPNGGMCSYTFDASTGQGTFSVVLPSLGDLAVSNYVFIIVEGGTKIFFIEKVNGIFVMIAEKQEKKFPF